MKSSCILTPEINGESSALYKEMVDKGLDRPVINFIYAMYLQAGVQAQMNAAGYKVNKQGQHRYKDIYKFLGLKEFLSEQELSIESETILLGSMNKNHSYVDITNVEDAYNLAQQYNNSHTGRFAYVVQHGDAYNVIITNKDSKTVELLYNFNKQQAVWDVFKEEVRKAGIDVDTLIQSAGGTLNPINVQSFLNTLNIFKTASNDLMSSRDIKVLLTLGESLPRVQSLLSRGWGTLDEVASRCEAALKNPTSVSASTLNLINSTLNDAKLHSTFDVTKIIKHISDTVLPDFDVNSKEKSIQDTLKDLEANYQLNSNITNKKSQEIKTMQDVAEEAISTLTREIRRLESDKGITKTVKELEDTKNLIASELSSKRTYFGITKFLEQALNYSNKVHDLIMNVPVGGTKAEYIRNCASALSKANNLRTGYYHILDALCEIDNLIIEENLTQSDKEELQKKALEVKKLLDEVQNKIVNELQRDLVISNLQEELGDGPENGYSYANVVAMMESDTSIVDYVGQLGKSSNPILAASGSIIRKAQIDRDAKLNDYSTRIGRVTRALYKAGYNSEFMYDEDGRIITEEGVDWNAYAKARKKAIYKFKNDFGYRGLVLKEAIEQWELQNTIEKVIDTATGRTERIPDDSYRLAYNPFNHLSTEQRAYYREIMAIKGELGTLLPKYAQQQFLPPQIRASVADLIGRAIRSKMSAKEVASIILKNIKKTIKGEALEDEEDFITNTRYSNYDNTPLRDIPIFYCSPLSNKDELLRDFSSAIQSFAATALNYEAMSGIRENIEAIQSLVDDLDTAAGSTDIISFWDTVNKRMNKVLVKLRVKSRETRAASIMDAWVEKEFYNTKYKGNAKLNKWTNLLTGYNSVIRLSANVLGATANVLQGIQQTIIEAGGGRYYNLKDLAKAQLYMLGEGNRVGAIWDVLTGNKQNKFTLIHEFFDMGQDNYEDKSRQRYHKNAFRRLFGKFNMMFMYSEGEFLIRSINGMAVLSHEKVLLNGKKISLMKAFEKTNDANGYPELKLKDGITKLDGSPLTLNDEYFKEIKSKIKACSDDCFGAFAQADKGVINQHFLGRMTMNFRQWMVEHYSRRYRRKHWDYNKKAWVEGYYVTPLRLAKELIKGWKDHTTTWEVFKDELKPEDIANCKKALTEFTLFMILLGLNLCFGGEDDDEDTLWARFWLYQLKRAKSETLAAMPFGIISEAKKTINSPIPLITTINGLMYPITGIGDVTDTIEKGRYEGWNRYARNVLWYTVPFYKQVDQLIHMDEEDALFTIFDNKRY